MSACEEGSVCETSQNTENVWSCWWSYWRHRIFPKHLVREHSHMSVPLPGTVYHTVPAILTLVSDIIYKLWEPISLTKFLTFYSCFSEYFPQCWVCMRACMCVYVHVCVCVCVCVCVRLCVLFHRWMIWHCKHLVLLYSLNSLVQHKSPLPLLFLIPTIPVQHFVK